MGYLKKGLGANIKLLRKSQNMTQEKLAEMIDIDRRQLARIEAGESFVTAETIEKICEIMNVSVKSLFDIENSQDDNMTLEVIENYRDNYKKLNTLIKKTAESNVKTEFIELAFEAFDKRLAREKLKGYILGLEVK